MKEIEKRELNVSPETWINQETGEVREFAVVVREATDKGFHKVWIDDLSKILGLLGGSKIIVFKYILDNINPYSNEFGGTVREISEKCNVDKNTVSETLSILTTANFIKKVRTGTYLVNSETLVQGKHNKRQGIMIRYNTLK
jgi:hypothetical protein